MRESQDSVAKNSENFLSNIVESAWSLDSEILMVMLTNYRTHKLKDTCIILEYKDDHDTSPVVLNPTKMYVSQGSFPPFYPI